jgi:hypothetical protein
MSSRVVQRIDAELASAAKDDRMTRTRTMNSKDDDEEETHKTFLGTAKR